MKRLIQLVVLAAILWAGFEYLRPWILEFSGDARIRGSESERCVARLELTREELLDKIEKWQGPPVQVSRWAGARRLLIGRVSEARRQCECPGNVCRYGQQAVDELARILADVDREMSAGRVANLEYQFERFDDLMTEAARASD